MYSDDSLPWGKIGIAAAAVVVGVIALIMLFTSSARIGAGHVGVVANWGAIDKSQQPLSQGWHWLAPMAQSVEDVSTQPQNHTFREVAAASKELQNVYVDGGVNYHIDADQAPEIVTEGGLDAVVAKVFDPAFQDYIKEVVPQYGAQDVLASRAAIRDATLEELRRKATAYGIHVDDLFITGIHFDKTYTDAIEAAAVAKQDKVKADNEAAAKVAAAQGDAEANRLRQQTLTPEQLQYMALQNEAAAIARWDGKMPTTELGDSQALVIGPSVSK